MAESQMLSTRAYVAWAPEIYKVDVAAGVSGTHATDVKFDGITPSESFAADALIGYKLYVLSGTNAGKIYYILDSWAEAAGFVEIDVGTRTGFSENDECEIWAYDYVDASAPEDWRQCGAILEAKFDVEKNIFYLRGPSVNGQETYGEANYAICGNEDVNGSLKFYLYDAELLRFITGGYVHAASGGGYKHTMVFLDHRPSLKLCIGFSSPAYYIKAHGVVLQSLTLGHDEQGRITVEIEFIAKRVDDPTAGASPTIAALTATDCFRLMSTNTVIQYKDPAVIGTWASWTTVPGSIGDYTNYANIVAVDKYSYQVTRKTERFWGPGASTGPTDVLPGMIEHKMVIHTLPRNWLWVLEMLALSGSKGLAHATTPTLPGIYSKLNRATEDYIEIHGIDVTANQFDVVAISEGTLVNKRTDTWKPARVGILVFDSIAAHGRNT